MATGSLEQRTLIERPLLVDELYQEQLDLFTNESVWVRQAGHLAVSSAVEALLSLNGERFVGADIGGDKLSVELFEVEDGLVEPRRIIVNKFKSKDGNGYLDQLEHAARSKATKGTDIGISYAGPLDGTKVIHGPNLSTFILDLTRGYNGDFQNLFPNLKGAAMANDAVAGLVESAIRVERQKPGLKDLIYTICGSGFGGAVLKDGVLYATEVGHVPVIPQLNPFKVREICNLYNKGFVCIENVAGSRAGIERAWVRLTNMDIDGFAIEEKFQQGNEDAAILYDNSALLMSHAIVGLAKVFNIELNAESTAVIGHGGGFRFHSYPERVVQYLKANGYNPHFDTTYSFSNNACLNGAASLAALASVN